MNRISYSDIIPRIPVKDKINFRRKTRGTLTQRFHGTNFGRALLLITFTKFPATGQLDHILP